jgi:hypothetical protein
LLDESTPSTPSEVTKLASGSLAVLTSFGFIACTPGAPTSAKIEAGSAPSAATAANRPAPESAKDADAPLPELYAEIGGPCPEPDGGYSGNREIYRFCGTDGRVAGFLLPVDVGPPAPKSGVIVKRLEVPADGAWIVPSGVIYRDGPRLSATRVTCPRCRRIMGVKFYGEPARLTAEQRADVRRRFSGFVDEVIAP